MFWQFLMIEEIILVFFLLVFIVRKKLGISLLIKKEKKGKRERKRNLNSTELVASVSLFRFT